MVNATAKVRLEFTPEEYQRLESAVQRAMELLGEAIEYTPHGPYHDQEIAPLQDEIDKIEEVWVTMNQQALPQLKEET